MVSAKEYESSILKSAVRSPIGETDQEIISTLEIPEITTVRDSDMSTLRAAEMYTLTDSEMSTFLTEISALTNMEMSTLKNSQILPHQNSRIYSTAQFDVTNPPERVFTRENPDIVSVTTTDGTTIIQTDTFTDQTRTSLTIRNGVKLT